MGERELVEKSLKGEEGAFDVLVEQNRAAVFRHCLGVVKDEQIAQDLTQETFLHAFHHLTAFKMQARFSTWLWRIAHNLSLNYLRKQRGLEGEFKEELLPIKFFKKEKPLDEDLLASIHEAIESLPPKQREVFELYALKHMPQKEIGATLGISCGTVRSRLFYARQKVRKFLEKAD